MPRLPRHRDAPDWHRKARARDCTDGQRQRRAWALDGLAQHWRSIVPRSCGAETKRTAPEKLRLPRTCAGEAGQSHGEEVLYNALELNSNRFYKKKGDK